MKNLYKNLFLIKFTIDFYDRENFKLKHNKNIFIVVFKMQF